MTFSSISDRMPKARYIVNWVTSVDRDNQTDNERPVALSQAPIPMRGKINQDEVPYASRL